MRLVARAAMAASSSADGSSGADSSCFCEKVANLQLQLSPAYLGNEDAGVREQLRLAQAARLGPPLGGRRVPPQPRLAPRELAANSAIKHARTDLPHLCDNQLRWAARGRGHR